MYLLLKLIVLLKLRKTELAVYGHVPTNIRPICGMRSPTNANMPAMAVAIDASNTATTETIKRARFTLKPKIFRCFIS